MREAVRAFVTDVAEQLPLRGPVVEIGARPAEGQEELADVRAILGVDDYLACDLQPGPGIDQIEDIHELSFADGSVGTILALDTLEHVADPIRAMHEVHRVLQPGGVAVISSVMFFVIHAHPWDYWRFTPEGFAKLLEPFDSSFVLAQGWEHMPETVLGLGVKGRADLGLATMPRSAAIAAAWGQGRPVELGPMRMSMRDLWRLTARETATRARRKLTGR